MRTLVFIAMTYIAFSPCIRIKLVGNIACVVIDGRS